MALGSSALVREESLGRGTGVLGRVCTTGLSSPPCLRAPCLWKGKGWSLSCHSFPWWDTAPAAEPTVAIGAGGLGCASERFEHPVYFIHIHVAFKDYR